MTTPKAARTPGPYEVGYTNPEYVYARGASTQLLRFAVAPTREDAQFIVTACNAHDADQQRIAELDYECATRRALTMNDQARIAELEEALRYVVMVAKGSYSDAHPIASAIEQARAALAKGAK